MGIFEHFPYTNFHELNLDWILRALKELEHTIDQFVAINALKYADPIQWNITSQYEKNTIVIDPVTGVAYISVQPVPSGVALTNTDYWTVVFDLGSFVTKAAKNFTSNYEEATTLTATMSLNAGDWVVWGDTLYYAMVNITAGDSYVVDSNIKQFTMEDVVGHPQDLNTVAKDNLVHAINEVLQSLRNVVGDMDSLTTTDKSNLVNAINEIVTVVTQLISDVGDLSSLVTTDKTNLVAAINEVANNLSTETNQRNSADTSLQSQINTKEFNVYNRKYLLVGDSYGDEAGEWADRLITNLNLAGRATNLCVGGAGFYHPNPVYQFITQLENYTGDRSLITDIVVCGGLNDSTSASPSAYSNVQTAMTDFNNYVRSEYPYAKVSLGYIGNGNDLDPNSLIGSRVYNSRQCCRYIYYDMAGAFGWTILKNVEYAMCNNVANIDSDGVHPTNYGSSALARAIGQALYTGSADVNYPIFTAAPSPAVGTLSGNLQFKMHNNICTLMGRALEFAIPAGTTFTSGSQFNLLSSSTLMANDPVTFLARLRAYNITVDGTPMTSYYYFNARLTLYNNILSMIPLESDGSALTAFSYATNGTLVIEDFDFEFDSMILA